MSPPPPTQKSEFNILFDMLEMTIKVFFCSSLINTSPLILSKDKKSSPPPQEKILYEALQKKLY